MTFARRLMLIGSDHCFNQLIQTHIHKTFLLNAPVIRTDDVMNLVTRDTDGVLLFLASDPSDAERIEATIREIQLMNLPCKCAVLETEDHALSRRLGSFSHRLEACFVWSSQIRELNGWLKRIVTPGVGFIDPVQETNAERVRRKLLTLTPSLAYMTEQLEIAAAHDVTVLIEGETGTGKTHLARLIHDCSARAANRFLVVACGTLSGNLIAAEFFGHAKGAFTGADGAKVGKFAAAGQGTVLLDEIDTLGLEHQANLLRVIETGEYEPVGSNETQICQARIIAATNWNLAEAVERGTFRRDLYYRLHVIMFHLPPLRARIQDIAPLVRGMVAKYATRYHKKIYQIDSAVLQTIEAFPWPGNIRQLENVIQQAVLTCTSDTLGMPNLPAMLQHKPKESKASDIQQAGSLVQNRESVERTVILRALEKVNFSRTRAAKALGVSRVTLYKKMKKYGLLAKPHGLAPSVYDGSAYHHTN